MPLTALVPFGMTFDYTIDVPQREAEGSIHGRGGVRVFCYAPLLKI